MTRHNKKYSATRPAGLISRIIGVIAFVVTLIISIGFTSSAWSGMVSPLTNRIAPIWAMTFSGWFALMFVVFVIDLIWWRRCAIMAFLSILVCLPQVWDFCPVNLPKGKMSEEQSRRAFTLMTYNVLQFHNQDTAYSKDYNEALQYIISQQPDIVCLEEAPHLRPTAKINITPLQIDTLVKTYPYMYFHNSELAFFSKYEAESIPINFPTMKYGSGEIAGWRINKDGTVINVFVVHLRSFQLSPTLRDLWREITTPDAADAKYIEEARKELTPLIVRASKDRALQAQWIESMLRKYGGENTIVCGDFNDLENSYPVNYLVDNCNLQQTYPKVGLGPMITYNSSHFYFRIDHILYRGKIKPYSMRRGNIKASDHYPLIATFLVDK